MFSSKEQSSPASDLCMGSSYTHMYMYVWPVLLSVGGLALTQLQSEPQQFQSELFYGGGHE